MTCSWLSLTQVNCLTLPGVGGPSLGFQIASAGQTSAIFAGSLVAYAVPAVSFAPLVNSALLDTRGGGQFNISGSSFGPVGTAAAVSYSSNFTDARFPLYSAPSCTVLVSDVLIGCSAAPGVGGSVAVIVTVGGQSSNISATGIFSYAAPVITGLSGLGAIMAPTTGTFVSKCGGFRTPLSCASFSPHLCRRDTNLRLGKLLRAHDISRE
jgi:hypothetical protein